MFIKGTVSIISSDPPCKDINARARLAHNGTLKYMLCLIKYELDMHVSVYLNFLSFVTCAFLDDKKQWRNSTFSFTLLIRLRFHDYVLL